MSDEASIVSIIGSCKRTNRWRIADDTSVKTLFGRCYLDMRDAECSGKLIEIDVLSVFANVTIIVPEGCDVKPSGGAIFGSSNCLVPVSDKTCKLPPIEIESTTILGRLRIATISEISAQKPFWRRNAKVETDQREEVSSETRQSVSNSLDFSPEPELEQPDFAPPADASLADTPGDDGAPSAPVDIIDMPEAIDPEAVAEMPGETVEEASTS